MYIREKKTKNRKTGAVYVKHQLVESFRSPEGPRQRIIMELGFLSLSKANKQLLAAMLENRLIGQISLFEDKYPDLALIADEAMSHYTFVQSKSDDVHESKQDLVTIDLESAGTMQHRCLGPDLVGHVFWNKLGLDGILAECGFSNKEMALAQAVVVGRLVAPSSDLATWEWLKDRSALLELLPVDLGSVGKDAIYEIADRLIGCKDRIEDGLRMRENELFPNRSTLFLYDLTNTYFEGRCLGNEPACRGHSKDDRFDCPLVTLAVVVDVEGFAITSRIYAGNQAEPKTLEDILEKLYPTPQEPFLFDPGRPTIVMDKGIATKDNLALLKERGYPYLLIERRATEKDYIEEFEQAPVTFESIQDRPNAAPVFVKKIPIPQGVRVLCLSEGREAKEEAMDELKEKRFLEDLERLEKSVRKGTIKVKEKVYERAGRLKERYPRIAPHYDLSFELSEDQTKIVGMSHSKKVSREKKKTLSGCYVIETSHQDLEAEEIWRLYTSLTRVEDAFRALKSELGMRPVYHQNQKRTQGHLWISVLACHILNAIEKTLQQEGDHRSWSSIRQVLTTHQRSTIVFRDEHRQIHHMRVSGIPEKPHKDIYERLKVKDPLKRKHVELK